ncbi:Sorting nexin-14 [Bulinus truncatus]|nr:Sorting nexin-14 [Bulinus truncatus]
MQFLKSEAAVNVLQFCLACSDFNRRILNPDASQSEFVDLHMTVKDLFKNYCAPNALDRIKFDDDIVDTLREVVEGPPDQVIKLRTSAPLFKAYEHAYNLLENNFLPMFHQSDDYYSMICGDRPNASLAKQTSRQAKKKDFTLAQFGNKLKDVFKSSDERLSNNLEPAIDGISLNSLAPSVSIEEELDDTNSDFDHSLHDLSSWRVTIPRIGARPDPENPKKQFFVFIIDIRRLDIEEGEEKKQQWTVARRYAEFYVLEQKLTEFHGELTECQLPAKKSFGTNKHEFTEGKKSDFEQYLQKLLTKPHLRNSELLYQFLTTEHEFSTSFLPGIKLGKLKTKLMKEKGQHLDEFLINFATSTEASKPRSNKLSRRGSETSLLSTSSDKLSGTHFDNNMNFGFNPPISKRDLPHQVKDIDGAFDYLLFLLKDVFRAPVWFMGLMYSARIVLKETVESYLDWHIEYKLTQVTQEHRLVSLIHLLRDVLFFDDEPPRNDEDKKIRYELAYKGLQDFLPDLLQSALGTSNTQDGCQLLLQIFQQPKLNKQLSYVLLDIFVQELFPELK